MNNLKFGKICWALCAAVTLFLINCPSAFAADNTGWRYEVLGTEMLPADSIKPNKTTKLLEFKSINVAAYKTARLFVQVMESDFYKNKGQFTKDSKLRVACYHNTNNASSFYFEKEIPQHVTTYINGWVEIPIIGPDMRIVIWGNNIPATEMKTIVTLYLLD